MWIGIRNRNSPWNEIVELHCSTVRYQLDRWVATCGVEYIVHMSY